MQQDIAALYMSQYFYKSTVERNVGNANQNDPISSWKNTKAQLKNSTTQETEIDIHNKPSYGLSTSLLC